MIYANVLNHKKRIDEKEKKIFCNDEFKKKQKHKEFRKYRMLSI